MAYAEFYNLNANITYPFVTTGTDTFQFITGGVMPNGLIVDCGFTVGSRLEYDPEVGAVYLHSIKRNGDNLEFRFRVRPNDGTERVFIFVRDKSAAFGTTDYSEATGGPNYGVGFLVTGDLADFHATLVDGEEKALMIYTVPGYLDTYEATVEPSLIVSLKDHPVLTVSVGNMLRIDEQLCGDCGTPAAIDNTTVKLQAAASQMVGSVRIRPGYNIAVTADEQDDAITLAAVKGEGLGEVCDNDIVRYVGDVPDLGDRCRDFIFTIAGISPNDNGAFQLEGAGNFFVHPGATGFITVNSKIGQTTVCTDE